jgi:acetoacetyl-CoA reductase/3-oxoacyl-[acyl-carrier protein] reductase
MAHNGGMSESERTRVALVTGASRGLGAGIAAALAGAGLRVAVGYREREDAAQDVAASLPDARAVRLDLADAASVAAAFAHVTDELGAPDVLVNNAGMAQEKPFLELTDDDWERMLSVNLLGAVRCARQALPAMLERGFGRVVNVSSIGGQWGGVNQLHYAASKAALINFTRSLARLYSGGGVTANALAPGLVATEMSAPELDTDAGRAKVAGIPAGRLGTVAEVGAAVAWLCSDEAGYVTGQTLNLNGGMYFD